MISAIVLSHNDAPKIKKTLESLKWVDDLIVVDDNSQDNTVSIAKKFGASVYARSMAGDFAAQRNFGLSKAKGDWVLFVDSDEVVPQNLAKEIQGNLTEDAYVLRRIDVLWGRELKHGETANVKLLRLARRGGGLWTRPVHEVWDVQGSVSTLSNPLRHFPHPDVAQFVRDIDTYSTLNANYLYTTGIRSSLWQIVAYPAAKFFANYVWRLGFLDGVPGAVVAAMMSFHSFLTRSKLYTLQH